MATKEWEAEYEAHRFDDERYESGRSEPVVHARADVTAKTFPCGLDADVLVLVGADNEVTCDGCNAELQRRAQLKRTVLRTASSLLFAFVTCGYSRVTIVEQLRAAIELQDLAAIGDLSTELLAYARRSFRARPAIDRSQRFIAAVDAAGLRRTSQTSFGPPASAVEEMPF